MCVGIDASFCRWNPNIVGGGYLGVGYLCCEIDGLEPSFLFRDGLENYVILIVEHLLQTIQVGSETDQI